MILTNFFQKKARTKRKMRKIKKIVLAVVAALAVFLLVVGICDRIPTKKSSTEVLGAELSSALNPVTTVYAQEKAITASADEIVTVEEDQKILETYEFQGHLSEDEEMGFISFRVKNGEKIQKVTVNSDFVQFEKNEEFVKPTVIIEKVESDSNEVYAVRLVNCLVD